MMSDRLHSCLKHSIRRSLYLILRVVLFMLLLILLISNAGLSGREQVKAQEEQAYYEALQRFGIAAPYDYTVDQLNYFNVGAVLDWRMDNPINLPENIDYIHVVRLSDAEYPTIIGRLSTAVPANPGEVWIIGNEPDRSTFQDDLIPTEYAARYYEVANYIRSLDPEAKLGFGSIVQPTPIRLCYLNRTLEALDDLSGNRADSLRLIDIWSIHAFILNETSGWGADIPVGINLSECEGNPQPLVITDLSETHSISKFQELIVSFREWLALKGEQDKPVWITEYGSLMPIRVGVSEQDTSSYMLATFDFLLNAKDVNIGMPADKDFLIQRWFWYSLNGNLFDFGGSLLDPDEELNVTLVGQNFKQYTDLLRRYPLYFPLVIR